LIKTVLYFKPQTGMHVTEMMTYDWLAVILHFFSCHATCKLETVLLQFNYKLQIYCNLVTRLRFNSVTQIWLNSRPLSAIQMFVLYCTGYVVFGHVYFESRKFSSTHTKGNEKLAPDFLVCVSIYGTSFWLVCHRTYIRTTYTVAHSHCSKCQQFALNHT